MKRLLLAFFIACVMGTIVAYYYGRATAYPEGRSHVISEATVEIPLSPEMVYEFVVQGRATAKILPNVESISADQSAPFDVGDTITLKSDLSWGPTTYRIRFVDLMPGQYIAIRLELPPLEPVLTLSINPTAEGHSRLQWRLKSYQNAWWSNSLVLPPTRSWLDEHVPLLLDSLNQAIQQGHEQLAAPQPQAPSLPTEPLPRPDPKQQK